MQAALESQVLAAPKPQLVANVTAEAVADPQAIKDLLVRQVTGTVRWRESVLFMKDQGVESLVEIGNGKVLAGLARRIDKDLQSVSLGTPQDIEAFTNTL
jgi:[acyl-carrier-protein] S-malonyltransferase